MGKTVYCNGKQTRVTEDNLIHAECRRVTGIECFYICLGNGPDTGNCPEESKADLLGLFSSFRFFHLGAQNHGDLLVQVIHHVFNEHGQIVTGVVDTVGLIATAAGVDDAHQLPDHIDDDSLVRVLEL